MKKSGCITTVTGKGSYVCEMNVKDIMICNIGDELREIIKKAKFVGLTLEEGERIIKNTYTEK